jgi:hypothetical protein
MSILKEEIMKWKAGIFLFAILLISVAGWAQSAKGLKVTNIQINGGLSGTQPLLPDDLKYDGLTAGECLWWDRCGLEGGKPYTVQYLPEFLQNKTFLVMTANDKWTQDVPNYLTCTVNKPVTMYVLYDARQFEGMEFFPSWLTTWTLLSDSVIVNDCYGDSCKPREFDVYTKDFPAGDIALGSNNENGYDFSALQYVPVWEVNEGGTSAVNEYTPEQYELTISNYPNPFNPVTHITFTLPNREYTEITIYNLKGVRVRTLFAQMARAGKHELVWDASDETGHQVPSGTYFYHLKTRSASLSGKMTLIK